MALRIRILTVFFGLLFAALITRLFFWQVIKSRELSDDARNQHASSSVTSAPRGNILASDGSFWVLRKNAWLIFADTNKLEVSPEKAANAIAPLLAGMDDKSLLLEETLRIQSLLSKKGAWIPVKQKVDDETKRNIEALDIKGIEFEAAEDRFYPEASSAAQLLGFVGKDENGENVGYFGLEGYYNLALEGKPGFFGGEKDAKGNPILIAGTKQVSAISGVDLATSIDKRIQIAVETKLKEGMEKYGATGGSVTVMEPSSGQILAMTSFPSFDPINYQDYSDALFRNPVISDSFEPGSIIKPIVMAAGLDAGVIDPDTACDICAGPLRVDRFFIKTWNNEYNPGITMTEVIIHSDNVGMSFVGQKLGADALYDYLTKFGIGNLSGIDLQGEAAPPLRKRGTWNVVDLATASFGQGVAVTGIQMIRAISAIANGGYLVTPRVVEKVQGEGWSENAAETSKYRIISEKAAAEVTQMMVKAANEGEAKWAKIPGFTIAGKTGTAQIAVEGHYDEENTIHSFVGFAPWDKPKFVMLVTLKSPSSSPWAAETAAPLWYSIARELFPYLGVPPSE
ncbi:MAG TPA: penicillin-binding protein 2 [Patescibacteria group bacterium]|nr:penicillin-binding protein 2 [Patescibacteria group bacterium]